MSASIDPSSRHLSLITYAFAHRPEPVISATMSSTRPVVTLPMFRSLSDPTADASEDDIARVTTFITELGDGDTLLKPADPKSEINFVSYLDELIQANRHARAQALIKMTQMRQKYSVDVSRPKLNKNHPSLLWGRNRQDGYDA